MQLESALSLRGGVRDQDLITFCVSVSLRPELFSSLGSRGCPSGVVKVNTGPTKFGGFVTAGDSPPDMSPWDSSGCSLTGSEATKFPPSQLRR